MLLPEQERIFQQATGMCNLLLSFSFQDPTNHRHHHQPASHHDLNLPKLQANGGKIFPSIFTAQIVHVCCSSGPSSIMQRRRRGTRSMFRWLFMWSGVVPLPPVVPSWVDMTRNHVGKLARPASVPKIVCWLVYILWPNTHSYRIGGLGHFVRRYYCQTTTQSWDCLRY